jgi:hypothetical protein
MDAQRIARSLLLGMLVAAPLAAADPLGPPGVVGVPGVDACGGLAPLVTSCTTGQHDWGSAPWGGFLGQQAIAGPDYTGTIESALVYAGGADVLRCDVVAGTTLGCAETGDEPPIGVWPLGLIPFTHVCHSDDLGTTTEGGSGVWACEVTHAFF